MILHLLVQNIATVGTWCPSYVIRVPTESSLSGLCDPSPQCEATSVFTDCPCTSARAPQSEAKSVSTRSHSGIATTRKKRVHFQALSRALPAQKGSGTAHTQGKITSSLFNTHTACALGDNRRHCHSCLSSLHMTLFAPKTQPPPKLL